MHHWTLIVRIVVLLAIAAQSGAQTPGAPDSRSFDFDRQLSRLRSQQSGIAAGPLRLLPSASVSMGYDSNVFATPSSREEDAVAITEMELLAETQLGALFARGQGFLRDRRYLDWQDQGGTEYGASGGIRLQLTAQDDVTMQFAGQHRLESRAEIETPDTRELSFYDEWRGSLGYSHTFNRLSLQSGISGRVLNYRQSAQQFRDRTLYRGDLRAAYRLSPGVSLVATTYYSDEDYDTQSARTSPLSTTGALLGVGWDITDVLEAELSGGYLEREWEARGRATSFTARGSATFRPTRLTTFSAELSRADATTTVAGAFSKIRSQLSLGMLHEYSRGTSLYANGRAVLDEFEDIDRTERACFATVGVASSITRHYVVGAQYEYAMRNSAAIGESFVRHLVSLSFAGRF